jgi:hypothetical protein
MGWQGMPAIASGATTCTCMIAGGKKGGCNGILHLNTHGLIDGKTPSRLSASARDSKAKQNEWLILHTTAARIRHLPRPIP